MRHLLAFTLLLSTTLLAPGLARAAINDFTLSRFGTLVRGATADCQRADCVRYVEANNELFRQFATDFGMVMSPKFLAPAETLGQAGFDIGVDASFSAIANKEPHWTMAMQEEGTAPNSLLSTMQVHVRKGLPFSFELGGTLTKLFESEAYALGGELKWAFNEGFYYLPDIAARVAVNRLLGSRDLDLLTGGFDLSISHPFGIGGMLSLTPYAGWNMLFIHASSHVLDATAGLPGFTPPYCNELTGADSRVPNPDGSFAQSPECQKASYAALTADYRANFVLSRQNWSDMAYHRGFFGLRLKITVVSLVAEAILAEEVQTYSARIGMDF
ncbi:MAG: hypothetical protein RBU45_01405 [Myxococcota bacterium]|jgi:hypothetical protein|nr:hypothetical protein [Myxococcota bacterium]